MTRKGEEKGCDAGPTADTCGTPCPGCGTRQGSRHPGHPNSLCKGWKRQKKQNKKHKIIIKNKKIKPH